MDLFDRLLDTPKIFTVSELTGRIRGQLEGAFPTVWVGGEITGWRPNTSGHVYLTLRDASAVLPAVVFRGEAARLRIHPKDGDQVVARGRLSVYPPHGKYQFVIEELIFKGLGAQEIALQQLKQKLSEKGYFRAERKRPLPRYPQRIALVTSPTGAAVRDMLEILGRRWPAAEIWVCPVRVQGETAAAEIAAALVLLNRLHGVDVLIVGRGGGSTEDLSAFNAERVADAIFRSQIPVVSAVGHEIDVTIADLVADRRALTPSEAAELVAPDRAELRTDLDKTALRMRELLRGRLQIARQRLGNVAERRAFRRPLERVQELRQRLDDLGDRTHRALRQRLERCRQQIQAKAAQLATLSPLNVLARGYSLTRLAADGQIVRSAGQVRPGDLVVTIVRDGQFASRVEEIAQPPGI